MSLIGACPCLPYNLQETSRDQGKKIEEENLQLLNVLLIDNAFVPGNCYLWEISENIYPIYLKSGPP